MQLTIIKKTAALFLITAMLYSLFVGCAEKKPYPEHVISMLQNAINECNVDGLLQCIDSNWASQIESLLTFTIGTEEISTGSFITLVKTVMPLLPFVNDKDINSEDLPQVEFTVLKTDISDCTATVALSGILTWGTHIRPFAATVDMKLDNNAWVICGVR